MVRPSALAAFSPSAKPASTASTTASSDRPAVDVQFGRESDLRVDDVVGSQVFDALVRHPVQRLRCLHHPDGVRERFQVAHQRSAVRGGAEQRREFVDVGRGQVVVAVRLGQLQHRGRPQPAVEMVVQQGLRRVAGSTPSVNGVVMA